MTIALSDIYQAYMYSYPHKTAYEPLKGINVFDYLNTCDLAQAEIYFHIPFCATKCGYCNLFSITGQTGETFDRYLDAMKQQIAQFGLPEIPGNSQQITIGGGTPLIFSEAQLDKLLCLLPDQSQAYTCIETSPNETTKTKLQILETYQTDRVSIGVQSFLDNELAVLKRHHPTTAVYQALELLKAFRFPTLNLDLIYGIPEQTLSSLQTSLEEGLKFEPDEFFVYPLYIRQGTALANTGLHIHEHTYAMYLLARDILTSSGYTQISMRRFVKTPSPSPTSCGFDPMLAIGCGGRSYLGNLHYSQPYAPGRTPCKQIIEHYIATPNKTLVTHGYLLNQDELKRRFVIKNLLHVFGVSPAQYRETFLSELCDDFPVLYEWSRQDNPYTRIHNTQISLTPLGLSLSDNLGPSLISQEVRHKTEQRKRLNV
ncbi:MAG: STM4012 family radical SAM protein [Peptococcaceae bacterium]|nr:STM4012 family radical SAM protein [Peptococcaceae bacterium]